MDNAKLVVKELWPLFVAIFGSYLFVTLFVQEILGKNSLTYHISQMLYYSIITSIAISVFLSLDLNRKNLLGVVSISGLCTAMVILYFIESFSLFIFATITFLVTFAGTRILTTKIYERLSLTLAMFGILTIGVLAGIATGFVLVFISIPGNLATMLGLFIVVPIIIIYGGIKIVEKDYLNKEDEELFIPVEVGFMVASMTSFLYVSMLVAVEILRKILNHQPSNQINISPYFGIISALLFGFVIGYYTHTIRYRVKLKGEKSVNFKECFGNYDSKLYDCQLCEINEECKKETR